MNMTYCAFRNALLDLEQCKRILVVDGLDGLNNEEKPYAERLIEVCRQIINAG